MPEASLLLVNATFWSPGHTVPGPAPHALAVSGPLIIDVGPEARVRRHAARRTTILDLAGAVVIPGFIDCHAHLTQVGLDAMGVDVSGATGLEAVFESILDHTPHGPVVRAWGFDPEAVAERRWPTAAELDALRRPVLLSHAEIHACLPSTGALGVLGLDIPPGVLTGGANSMARQRLSALEDDETRMEGLRRATARAIARGVTTVHAMEGGDLFGDRDLVHMVEAARSLPLEVVLYPQLWDVKRVLDLGLPRIGGCILLDGSPGVRTAAMFSDYPGHPGNRGILYRSQDEVDDLALEATRAGMQLAVHASGEAAIDQALTALERAGPPPHPPRIEHFEVPAPGQTARAARLGAVLSLQPAFDHFWSGEYVTVLGPEAGRRANPVASCIRAGATVVGGSDAGVTPIDPLLGIHAAVNHSRPGERPSLEEAFCMFTSWAATAGCTRDRGRLEPGTRADLVILDPAPWQTGTVAAIGVRATMVGGRLMPAPRGGDGAGAGGDGEPAGG